MITQSVLSFVVSLVLSSVYATRQDLTSAASDIFPWESSSWNVTEILDLDLRSQQAQSEEKFVTAYNGNITLLSEPWYIFLNRDVQSNRIAELRRCSIQERDRVSTLG